MSEKLNAILAAARLHEPRLAAPRRGLEPRVHSRPEPAHRVA